MKIDISKEIFEKFPGLNLGVVIAKNIQNSEGNSEIIELLRCAEEKVRDEFVPGELAQHPKLAPWRQAYSSFGAKPKKYKCSIEALIRRVLNDEALPDINNLVNLYNYLSLKHVLPMGGDDLDNVEGNIHLKIADGSETFIALNSDEVKNPKQGEVVYADNNEILCRRWNWRECEKTKLTSESKNIIIYAEGLPPVTQDEVESAVKEIAEDVKKFLGGENAKVKYYILNEGNSLIEF